MEITTPGRICLFGEHSDYLGLPIIAMAISLRAKILGQKELIIKLSFINPTSMKQKHFLSRIYVTLNPAIISKAALRHVKTKGLFFHLGLNAR